MSDDLVKRARDALNGVTEGPWIDYEFSADHWVAFKSDDSGPAMRIGSWHDQREANARFIAASRDLVPAMADRIEELEAKLAKAVDAGVDVGASLSAAISLLERGGKKAAASDKMFTQMLVDYNASLWRFRSSLAELKGVKA